MERIATKPIALLVICLLLNGSLCQLTNAAALSAAVAGDGANAADAAAGSAAGATTTTTTTTTSTSESANRANNVEAAPAAAIVAVGPFSGVHGLVGGALNFASMPLNTISSSLSQMGVPTLATAPLGAVSNLFHQVGSVYGR